MLHVCVATEHQRVVGFMSRDDVVYDMFAGVGPFAIPAAKKGCKVFANDLNPESYKWLHHNVKLNKIKTDVHLFNMDGREFVTTVAKPDMLSQFKAKESGLQNYRVHFIMNLPATAVEFLDVFRGLISGKDLESCGACESDIEMPTIHCYCFSKSQDPVGDAQERTEAVLGQKLSAHHSIRIVRNVAPNKEMLCVTFVMPITVMLQSDICHQDNGGILIIVNVFIYLFHTTIVHLYNKLTKE